MKLIKELKEIIIRKELKILPGNLAYSFFLSLIPIVSLIFYFTTTLNLPNDILQNFIAETFPKGVADLLQPVFTNQLTLDSFIPLCLGIIVAMNGCGTIIVTSNTIFRFENSSIIKRTIKSLLVNLKSGKLSQGGSTISQQLIKNTHLTNKKTYLKNVLQYRQRYRKIKH